MCCQLHRIQPDYSSNNILYSCCYPSHCGGPNRGRCLLRSASAGQLPSEHCCWLAIIYCFGSIVCKLPNCARCVIHLQAHVTGLPCIPSVPLFYQLVSSGTSSMSVYITCYFCSDVVLSWAEPLHLRSFLSACLVTKSDRSCLSVQLCKHHPQW